MIEAVPVEEYERPKKLPSEVDPQVKTGLLLCQDINFLNPHLRKNSGFPKKPERLKCLVLIPHME